MRKENSNITSSLHICWVEKIALETKKNEQMNVEKEIKIEMEKLIFHACEISKVVSEIVALI